MPTWLKRKEIIAAIILACGAIIAALVGAPVRLPEPEEPIDPRKGSGTEDIVLVGETVTGGEQMRVSAHNRGSATGTLAASVVVVAEDDGGTEIERHDIGLNPGIPATARPFTLAVDEARRYFLKVPQLPEKAAACRVEFKVVGTQGRESRSSGRFKCLRGGAGQ